jgi:hypothetical protein
VCTEKRASLTIEAARSVPRENSANRRGSAHALLKSRDMRISVSEIKILHPWETQALLHNSAYRPSPRIHHQTATYTKACLMVERGEAEWIGEYLAEIPHGKWVLGRSGGLLVNKYVRRWKP